MTQSCLASQSDLPRSVPLFRYTPVRTHFSFRDWNPAAVQTADDLPPYLILGDLDTTSFEISAGGWSARWQGTEDDTYFDVDYKAREGRWEIRQTWCGLDGGYSLYPISMPLDKVIGQAMYLQFPSNWDRHVKQLLEAEYQLTVIEQPQDFAMFCGIPDGAFRTIAFPIAVRNFRPVRDWLEETIALAEVPYPVSVEAKLVFHAINYIEGKAPDWTTQETVLFNQSLSETGLVPLGLPIREVGNDGSAAWTIRRQIYFLFIGLPFAGLTDFLLRMSSETGPIRMTSDPDFRFELRPIVMPGGFEMLMESVALSDKASTTRSFVGFSPDGSDKKVPSVQDLIENDKNSEVLLNRAEEISAGVIEEIDQIFRRVTGGAS